MIKFSIYQSFVKGIDKGTFLWLSGHSFRIHEHFSFEYKNIFHRISYKNISFGYENISCLFDYYCIIIDDDYGVHRLKLRSSSKLSVQKVNW